LTEDFYILAGRDLNNVVRVTWNHGGLAGFVGLELKFKGGVTADKALETD
jgi:hypothetical protein